MCKTETEGQGAAPAIGGNMRDILASIAALMISISLLLLGNGLQGTLIGIRAQIEGFSTAMTGFLMSGYFIGHILGALYVPRMVGFVGHIRVFAGLASLASAAALLHIVWIEPYFWAFLRGLTGACLAGLYLVTESWLNGRADNSNRGKIFSTYMVINLASVGLGQQLMNLADPAGFHLFVLGSVLFSLAVIPVALMRAPTPPIAETVRMKIKTLLKTSPVGTTGAFIGGLTNGAFWGMGPVYAYQSGLTTAQIAAFMSAVVFGGMALQWPLGFLSDRTDRRNVIALIAGGIAATGLVMALTGSGVIWLLMMAAFFFGGFLLTLGALCTAHINDHVAQDEFVPASGTILLVVGLGAVAGPYLAALLMQALGAAALFYAISLLTAALLVYVLYARSIRTAPEKSGEFVPASGAMGGVVSLIDPRRTYKNVRDKTRAARKKAARAVKSAAVKTARKTVKRKKKKNPAPTDEKTNPESSK
ncbi:MAG: MFS transporter [Micavibrio sp.]|nr:MAG: MFS transporter [Micavibrio sp.]